jgi:protein-S-isoprenylcysteine O-methyltransferase Ste14
MPEESKPPFGSPAEPPPGPEDRSAWKIVVAVVAGLIGVAIVAAGTCLGVLATILPQGGGGEQKTAYPVAILALGLVIASLVVVATVRWIRSIRRDERNESNAGPRPGAQR